MKVLELPDSKADRQIEKERGEGREGGNRRERERERVKQAGRQLD